MSGLCRVVTALFALAWAGALVLLLVSIRGLLGVTPDPLAGVFLLPLGLPWNLLVDRLGLPESSWPWLAALAPLVNLLLLLGLCRLARRR